ncbi:unnamed protein product [Anisakis simplex]|uniref:DP domain-containing protein n=1 Tax=Anisakis simplex TaxID=6269 RepID=A0A0M3JAD4_ANISI|nr:unnamed protein product [Anisakis simplex]
MELNRMIVTVPNTTDSTSPLPALRQRTVIDQSQSASVYVSSQSLKMPPKNQIRPLFPKKASPGLHHCLVEPVPLLSIDLSDQQRKKKMEANLRAFESIETRELLIDYLWKQGGEMIPTDDIPERFNSDAAKLNGLLGLSTVFICLFTQ